MKNADSEFLKAIFKSKSFGSSTTYENLLKYLVDCTNKGKIPKETTIASEVFGKSDFDPSQSTLVRVYLYNLRKKLEKYYENEGKDDLLLLRIPKGSYQVEVVKKNKKSKTGTNFFKVGFYGFAVVTSLLIAVLWFSSKKEKISDSILLKGFFTNDKNSMLIIGDYLIYKEKDSVEVDTEVIRNSYVNSIEEFTQFKEENRLTDYKLMNYSFLSTNSATWVKDLSVLFYEQEQDFVIRKMSEVTTKEVRDYNLFVVGLVKTFGFLKRYAEDSAIEFVKDGILFKDVTTGKKYEYKPGGNPDLYHKDYAVIARVPGANQNKIYLLGGIWDTGASQSVKMLTNLEMQQDIEAYLKRKYKSIPPYFELLIEVDGLNRMELSENKILHSNVLVFND